MIDVKQTLDAAILGDKAAEKQIYDFLFLRFRAVAKRRIGEDQDAKDLAQESCVTVLQKYKGESFSKGFEAWAYGVLRMKIGNYLQKKKVREKTFSSDFQSDRDCQLSSPEPEYNLKLRLIDCLKKIIARGFVRYARALNLIHKGFKVPEICSKLSVSPNHFYVILKRGRSMLKVCLESGRI